MCFFGNAALTQRTDIPFRRNMWVWRRIFDGISFCVSAKIRNRNHRKSACSFGSDSLYDEIGRCASASRATGFQACAPGFRKPSEQLGGLKVKLAKQPLAKSETLEFDTYRRSVYRHKLSYVDSTGTNAQNQHVSGDPSFCCRGRSDCGGRIRAHVNAIIRQINGGSAMYSARLLLDSSQSSAGLAWLSWRRPLTRSRPGS
jgi:hypothetical protein